MRQKMFFFALLQTFSQSCELENPLPINLHWTKCVLSQSMCTSKSKGKDFLVAMGQDKEQKRPKNTCFHSPSKSMLRHFKAPEGHKTPWDLLKCAPARFYKFSDKLVPRNFKSRLPLISREPNPGQVQKRDVGPKPDGSPTRLQTMCLELWISKNGPVEQQARKMHFHHLENHF